MNKIESKETEIKGNEIYAFNLWILLNVLFSERLFLIKNSMLPVTCPNST